MLFFSKFLSYFRGFNMKPGLLPHHKPRVYLFKKCKASPRFWCMARRKSCAITMDPRPGKLGKGKPWPGNSCVDLCSWHFKRHWQSHIKSGFKRCQACQMGSSGARLMVEWSNTLVGYQAPRLFFFGTHRNSLQHFA